MDNTTTKKELKKQLEYWKDSAINWEGSCKQDRENIERLRKSIDFLNKKNIKMQEKEKIYIATIAKLSNDLYNIHSQR